MYSVTISIHASDPQNPHTKYKTVRKTGMYIPKNKIAQASVIERETIDFFDKYFKRDHPHLTINYKVTISKIKTDFHITQQ